MSILTSKMLFAFILLFCFLDIANASKNSREMTTKLVNQKLSKGEIEFQDTNSQTNNEAHKNTDFEEIEAAEDDDTNSQTNFPTIKTQTNSLAQFLLFNENKSFYQNLISPFLDAKSTIEMFLCLKSNLNQKFEKFLPHQEFCTKRILWDADSGSRNIILFEFLKGHTHILHWKENNNTPKFKIFKTEQIDVDPSNTEHMCRMYQRKCPDCVVDKTIFMTVPTWYSVNKNKFLAPKIQTDDQGREFHTHFESNLREDIDLREFFIGMLDKNTMKLLVYGNLFPEEYKPDEVELKKKQLAKLLSNSALDSLHLNPMKKLSLHFKTILQKISSKYLRYVGIVDDGQQIFVRYYWNTNQSFLGRLGLCGYCLTFLPIFSKLPFDLITLPIALSMSTFSSRLVFAILFPIVLEMIFVKSFPQVSYLISKQKFSKKAKALDKSLDELHSYSDNSWAIHAIMSENSKFDFKKSIQGLFLNGLISTVYIVLFYWFLLNPIFGENV